VTLKTRTGWDHSRKNGAAIARLAQNSGIAAIAIHGRTRSDMYEGAAEHDTVRAIKAELKIPVIANGDIRTPADALTVLRDTGCDAVMIGRAAQGRPWIFDEVNFFLRQGEFRAPLALESVRDIMRAHLEDLYSLYGDETGVRVARKHLSWYCRQHPGQEAFRTILMRVQTPQEQLSMLMQHFTSGSAQAA
jgi:tRNA-dihydrouridine synthase B